MHCYTGIPHSVCQGRLIGIPVQNQKTGNKLKSFDFFIKFLFQKQSYKSAQNYYLFIIQNKNINYNLRMLQFLTEKLLAPPTWASITIYLVYYAYICLASIYLPSYIVKGHPNPKRGPQQTYKICGFRLTILTIVLIVLFGGVIPQLSYIKIFSISLLAVQFWPLWSTVNIVAILVSIFLYLKGKYSLSIAGEPVENYTHGSFGLDFWVGRELYPKIGNFDIKFVAYRVAMLFWLVLNLAFLAKQLEDTNAITLRMIVYQFATGFYVLDYFWNEQKMLTTWDIINEQFGYMLVFGDYVFIPFVFSIQCHYLHNYVDHKGVLNYFFFIVNILIYAIGYFIFRTANSQKNQFKTTPQKQIWGKKPQTVGGKLLVSGFWGLGRHMNYTGDIIMAFSYCLPCGLQIGGYFYLIYLTILLTHRAFRDDAKCAQKYKQIWVDYNKRVPYVFVPFQPVDAILRSLGKTLYKLTNQQNGSKDKKH